MWQKARVLSAITRDQRHLVGRELWVVAQQPESRTGAFVSVDDTPPRYVDYPSHETNLRKELPGVGLIIVRVGIQCVELLPEFVEDAPLMTWEEWEATELPQSTPAPRE